MIHLTVNYLIIFTAEYLIFFLGFVFLLLVLFSEKSRRTNMIIIMILALLIGFVIAMIGGRMFFNPRPFVVEHVVPLVSHNSDNGFPSEHALAAMTMALIVLIFNKKLGIILGITALIIGAARVLANVHHPIDIIGSVFIAAFAVYVAWLITKRI